MRQLFGILIVLVLQGLYQNASGTLSFPIDYSQTNKIDGRIIGGFKAPPHAFPYQIGVYVKFSNFSYFCGGSMISNNYVLTAAHCVENADNVSLVFGAQDIISAENTQKRVHSSSFKIHPDWDKSLYINDIALINITKTIPEDDYIKIIPLAKGDSTYDDTAGVLAGWGHVINSQYSVTQMLRYVNVTVLSNDECKSMGDDYEETIKPSHVCISGKSDFGVVGSCAGDSGGPLVVDGVQIGVVSFGDEDCSAGRPSVFSRVSYYTDWIVANSDVQIREY